LTTYHHSGPLSPYLGTLTSWNPLGHSRPVMGLLYLYLLDALFLKFIFDKELYMFQTDLLSIIRSLMTVYAAIGIFVMLLILTVC